MIKITNIVSINVFKIFKKSSSSNFILEQSEGIEFPDGQNLKVVAALFFCWIMAFLALLKGISSLGKVSYFTAIFPYVMITILIIRGCTLPGAIKGLEFYIMKVDMVKLFTLQVKLIFWFIYHFRPLNKIDNFNYLIYKWST